MTDNELIELARPMFAAGAGYSSNKVGDHRGRATIGDMMHGFFSRHPDVYWQAQNFSCADHIVSFDFSMHADATESDAAIEREGQERIEFTADGLIKKIVVEVK